jgi:glycosyltransferase involved in cell wall biosynthesis
VRQLAHAVARQGVRVTVIHPVALHAALKTDGFPPRSTEQPRGGEKVTVLRPRFLSLSARKCFARLGPFNPSRVTLRCFTTAAEKAIRRQGVLPDALYGHFLYLSGAAAVSIGARQSIPTFPGIGEGEFWTAAKFGLKHAKRVAKQAKGFVANSSVLKTMLHEYLDVPLEKIGVFPNGTDNTFFTPRDQRTVRIKYGLPADDFLVACVGNYLYKKGPCRVAQAIDGMPGVGGIFMGQGPVPPKGDNIVFNRRVPPAAVPEMLSAADIFVLPTLVEGSCNAIVEAMACGLPVVSSTGAFNDDILDAGMSIRVDPLDVGAIRDAVRTLKDDAALRARMADAALQRSAQFDINDRARRILTFMGQQS